MACCESDLSERRRWWIAGETLSNSELFIILFVPLTLTISGVLIATLPAGFGGSGYSGPNGVNPIQIGGLNPQSQFIQNFSVTINANAYTHDFDFTTSKLLVTVFACNQSDGSCQFPTASNAGTLGLLRIPAGTILFGLCASYVRPLPCPIYIFYGLTSQDIGACAGWSASIPFSCATVLNSIYNPSFKKAFGGSIPPPAGYVFTEIFSFNTTLYTTPSQAWNANALSLQIGQPAAPGQTTNAQPNGWQILTSIATFQPISAGEPAVAGVPMFSFIVSVVFWLLGFTFIGILALKARALIG